MGKEWGLGTGGFWQQSGINASGSLEAQPLWPLQRRKLPHEMGSPRSQSALSDALGGEGVSSTTRRPFGCAHTHSPKLSRLN